MNSNSKITSMVEQIRRALESAPLRKVYFDEQRDLQPHVQRIVDLALKRHSHENLTTTISVGGRNKPRILAFGTSFWPDLEISEDGKPVLGIEIKLVRDGQSASKALSETLGQSLIYLARYPKVFAFIVHKGKFNPKQVESNENLLNLLSGIGVEVVMRQDEGVEGVQ